MCFSATASFTTAAVLLPVGAGAVALARRQEAPARLLPLALLPWLFALQQGLEGLVWLGLDRGLEATALRPVALAYLAMAFALWPLWIPWMALRLCAPGSEPWRRQLIRGTAAFGVPLALVLWLPLLANPALITPVVQHGSIDYQVRLPWALELSHGLVTLVYALVILLPLLLVPRRRLWLLAAGLAAAFLVAQLAYLYAFSSVWCFFSALLSAVVLWALRQPQPHCATSASPPG